MISSMCHHVVKQEPRETNSTCSNLGPEECQQNCVLKCDPEHFTIEHVDVCEYERSEGDLKHEYARKHEDDPLAVEPNFIKQEVMQEELNIVDDDEEDTHGSYETVETIGGDDHLSSAREHSPDTTSSKTTKAPTSAIDSKNIIKSTSTKLVNHKRFECPKCPYKTGYACNLKSHMARHTEDKPYTCNLCSYSSKLPQPLRRHVKYIHAKKGKPYNCTMCSFRTNWNDSLRRHMKTHSESKPYTCTLCTFSSRYASSLKNHISTHNGFKPFQCTVCSYSTGWANALKEHVATHSREPLRCAHCSQTFRKRTLLNEHIVKKHQ